MSSEGLQAASELARSYADIVESLTPADWAAPSRCAGWSVQDLVAHTGSNFRVLVEPPDPAVPVPEGITAEQLQDMLVVQRRDWPAERVAEEFLQFREPAVAALAGMQDPSLADTPLTLTDLGTYPMHALADAFAFDLWCHLTVDLLAPEGPVDRRPPEQRDELLRPAVGWMLTGLPQMCPAVSDVLDRPLRLRLTGPGGGTWTLAPGNPVTVTRSDSDDPGESAATATSATTDFVLWGTARRPWRKDVEVAGDREYAARVLDAVNIV